MHSTLVASVALFGATVSSLSVGSAHVVNQCDYDVYLCNVPSSGGGFEESDKTLSPGESWEQEWTELSNRNGWSIKLSPTDSLSDILQYEYTFHNDGIIWYDLSCVNGNPWDQDWEITSSTPECSPKQQAYRYATDDAYGMQSCPQDAAITVTLCTGKSADNGTASGSGSGSGSGSSGGDSDTSSASPTASPVEYTSAVQANSINWGPASEAASPSASADSQRIWNWNNADALASEEAMNKAHVAATTSPTTFVTSASAVVTEAPGKVVTVYDTVIATDIVTKYAGSRRRHEHHAHAHNRHA